MSDSGSAVPASVESYYQRVAVPRGFLDNALLTGMTDEESLWQPRDDIPPIAWHVAHVVTTEVSIVLGMSANRWHELPEGWLEQYSLGSKVQGEAGGLAPLSEVLPEVHRLRECVQSYLTRLSEDAIIAPLGYKPPDIPLDFIKTLDDALNTLPVHEGHHNGEISLLRRLQGKPGMI